MKRLALRILVPVLFFAGWSVCKAWDARPHSWRDAAAAMGVWLCFVLLALFALYGRDVAALALAWRLGA